MIVVHGSISRKSEPDDKVPGEDFSLSAPWITYFNEIKALFEQDPEIKIKIHDGKYGDAPYIELRIDSQAKYDALCKLLPKEKEFGKVKAQVILRPSNAGMKTQQGQLFEAAFSGNPVFVEAIPIEGVLSNPITYVVFAKEVVQFYNDNGADPHGLTSTLYQDIARDVFENADGALYCTDSTK